MSSVMSDGVPSGFVTAENDATTVAMAKVTEEHLHVRLLDKGAMEYSSVSGNTR